MSVSMQNALAGQLRQHLESMKALRNANFDPTTNQTLVNFQVGEYLDPQTKLAPTRYKVQIRSVAIGDMVAKAKSLHRDFKDDVDAFVSQLKPSGFDWDPQILDPLSIPDAPPIEFKIYLPTDPLKPLAPEVYFTTKVWHPNIRWDNGHTCYGSKHDWADPTRSLADLCRRIYTMIAFLGEGSVNASREHYLNPAAGAWYEQMREKMPEIFPFSNRILNG